MNKEKLQKANELVKKISEHENALNCFEFDIHEYGRHNNPELPIKLVSTNPQLIIEHDDIEEGEGRTQTPVPIILSNLLIEMIKKAIKESLSLLQTEFDQL